MIVHKNDRNVWLQGVRMEEYLPELVKKFNSKKPSGAENETILNPVGDDLVDGYVSLYSTAGDVAKIIQRTSKAIQKMYMFVDKGKNNVSNHLMIMGEKYQKTTPNWLSITPSQLI